MNALLTNIEKVVSREKQLLFFAVPKVASRSILNIMVWHGGTGIEGEIYKCGVDQIRDDVRGLEKYDSFALLRDPIERLKSCYKDKILNPSKDDERWIVKPYAKFGLKVGMSFLDFCDFVISENGRDEISDRHWCSQHTILNNSGTEWYPKNIFDLDAPETWEEYLGRYSECKLPNRRLNKTELKVLDIPDQLRTQIENRYEKDFIMLDQVRSRTRG